MNPDLPEGWAFVEFPTTKGVVFNNESDRPAQWYALLVDSTGELHLFVHIFGGWVRSLQDPQYLTHPVQYFNVEDERDSED